MGMESPLLEPVPVPLPTSTGAPLSSKELSPVSAWEARGVKRGRNYGATRDTAACSKVIHPSSLRLPTPSTAPPVHDETLTEPRSDQKGLLMDDCTLQCENTLHSKRAEILKENKPGKIDRLEEKGTSITILGPLTEGSDHEGANDFSLPHADTPGSDGPRRYVSQRARERLVQGSLQHTAITVFSVEARSAHPPEKPPDQNATNLPSAQGPVLPSSPPNQSCRLSPSRDGNIPPAFVPVFPPRPAPAACLSAPSIPLSSSETLPPTLHLPGFERKTVSEIPPVPKDPNDGSLRVKLGPSAPAPPPYRPTRTRRHEPTQPPSALASSISRQRGQDNVSGPKLLAQESSRASAVGQKQGQQTYLLPSAPPPVTTTVTTTRTKVSPKISTTAPQETCGDNEDWGGPAAAFNTAAIRGISGQGEGRGGKNGEPGGGGPRRPVEGLGIWRRGRGDPRKVGRGMGHRKGVLGNVEANRGSVKGPAGRGRGGRGNAMTYLALNGERLQGPAAMERHRQDKAKIQQGLTFTAQRSALRAALLARQPTAVGEGGVDGSTHGGVPIPPGRASTEETDAKNLLSYPGWGIPEVIVRAYEELGVRRLFPWQVACLEAGQGRVLREGRNLVYSAPTSGGKTLVAELLMLRALTHAVEGGTVLFVVPFVALAEEKAGYFRRVWAGVDLGVKAFHSDAVDATLSEDVHVAVCTIERANALVNRLLERGELARVKVVVVDELHMVGDAGRGFLIEVMLSKVRLAASLSSQASLMASDHATGNAVRLDPAAEVNDQRGGATVDCTTRKNAARVQIIGLSATLPNLPQVAAWLDAHLYVTDFRPVQLSLLLCAGRRLERLRRAPPPNSSKASSASASLSTWEPLRELPSTISDETQAVLHLCLESVSQGHGVLVFCTSRAWTQRCAKSIARAFAACLGPWTEAVKVQEGRNELLARLRLTSVGLAKELEESVKHGVAFHHAGLTMEERTLLEGGFKTGVLSTLVATSTLAAGVNLPARRVIVRSRIGFDGQEMSVAQFQQMCGRAGRFGIDETGEAILMTREANVQAARAFTARCLPPMMSALHVGEGGGVERALLEVVMGRLAGCKEEEGGEGWLETFARCTLYAVQAHEEEGKEENGEGLGVEGQACKVLQRFRRGLDYLVQNRYIGRRSIAAVKEVSGSTVRDGGTSGGSIVGPDESHLDPERGGGQGILQGANAAVDGTRPVPAATREHAGGPGPSLPMARPKTCYFGTQLGAATFFAGMSPRDATAMLASLSQATTKGVILSSDLHLLFLCVPPNRWYFTPDWHDLARRSQRWAPEVASVAAAIGVSESAIERVVRPRSTGGRRNGGLGERGDGLGDDKSVGGQEVSLLRRFVYSLVLHDMLQEVPLLQLETGGVGRGTLQALQSEARIFCGMIVVFCKHLQWVTLARLIEGLSLRLEHRVGEDLLPLCRMGPELVHAARARALFEAGFQAPEDVAAARVEDVAAVLLTSMPFAAEHDSAKPLQGPKDGGRQGGGDKRVARRIADLIVRKAQEVARQKVNP